MKPFFQNRTYVVLIALLLAAVLAVVPFLPRLGAAVGRGSALNELLARYEFLPLLDELDRYYDGEDLKEDQSENLELDLKSHQRMRGPVLASFMLKCDAAGLPDPEVFLDPDLLRGAARKQACERLEEACDQEDVDPVEREVLALTNVLGRAESCGVFSREIGGRSLQIAWRQLGEDAVTCSNCLLCGFVLDYGRTPDTFAAVLWQFMGFLSVGLLLLLVAAVAVLVHSLLRARREALQKTTFVSNVSHELRTPLTSLMSYAEMLATGRCRTEEKKQKALGVILDEGRRLNRMILELLDFSRLERGTRRYVMEDFDLAATVRETAERLAGRFEANGLGVAVPDTLAVRSDRDTVRQILENLLTNAAKYAAKDGPVEVSAEVHGARVKLAVADRGPGMTRTQMKHAFDAFWRADNSTTRETNGYGIGLSVARAYARGLGGDLAVAARTGGGCVFTFEFPINQ